MPKYSPYAVSEQAIGLLLCLNRKIHKVWCRLFALWPVLKQLSCIACEKKSLQECYLLLLQAYSRVRDGNFALTDPYGMDIFGKVAGVIGTGQIGTNTVRILTGFGCKVRVCSRSLAEDKTQI